MRADTRRTGAFATAAAAAVLVVLTPSTASAAPGAPLAQSPARCSTGQVVATGDANIYTSPNSVRVIGSAIKGEVYRCDGIVDSHGTGWIGLLVCGTGGWSLQTSFADL